MELNRSRKKAFLRTDPARLGSLLQDHGLSSNGAGSSSRPGTFASQLQG